MKRRLFFVILIALHVFSIHVSAQSSRDRMFTGHVMDSFTGAAISDVEISLKQSNSVFIKNIIK